MFEFNPAFDLSNLNGQNGFAMNAVGTSYGEAGYSVSGAGDINGDDIADIIIGAPYSGQFDTGTSYVVFGKKGTWNASLELSTLSGKNGFAINGVTNPDNNGYSVSTAGDINGDGIADIIMGAYWTSPDGRERAGSSYVVFGKKGTWNASLDLSTLNGKNGFAINGVTEDDYSGCSVSTAGDVNGDGIADVVIGAYGASPGDRFVAGSTYVVFGKKTRWNASLDLSTLNGENGFVINGITMGDASGTSVANAGDVNGDGIADIIIGADLAGGGSITGASYVVFGKKTRWEATLELSTLNGKNGFAMIGARAGDGSGASVSTAGDINGDGIADVIIGADDEMGRYAGAAYVVFGKKTAWSASLELSTLNGKNGFAMIGVGAYDESGYSVSSAGDVNGDGIADIIIGALYAAPGGRVSAGSSYVVFGKKTAWSASLELSTLNGKSGFVINGVQGADKSGISVSTAGDVNGDGIADIIIGAYQASPGGRTCAGSSYVVFGKKTVWDASLELSTLNGKNGFVINGVGVEDYIGFSVSTAGDVNADGIADVIIGTLKGCLHTYSEGASYVVYGKTTAWNASLELSTLNGKNGFAINGVSNGDCTGLSVNTAGDINADGIADVLIGAPSLYASNAGSSYVIFGNSSGPGFFSHRAAAQSIEASANLGLQP